ncbi:MAG: acyl-CoA thioesterase [bacterium]
MSRNISTAIDYQTAFMDVVEPRPQDIDILGHVNNVVYLQWAQDMAVKHWSAYAPEHLQEKYIWIALRHEIDYRDPILPGDKAERRTWVGNARGPRFQRFVDIRRQGAEKFAARSLTVWCLIDKTTKRPQRITQEILETFGVIIDE